MVFLFFLCIHLDYMLQNVFATSRGLIQNSPKFKGKKFSRILSYYFKHQHHQKAGVHDSAY